MVWTVAALPTRVLPAKVTEVGLTVRVGGTPVQLSVRVLVVEGIPLDASSLSTVSVPVRTPAALGVQRSVNASVASTAIAAGLGGEHACMPRQPWSRKTKSPVSVIDDTLSVVDAWSATRLRTWTVPSMVPPPSGAAPRLYGEARSKVWIDWMPVPLAGTSATVSPVGSLLSSMLSVAVRAPLALGLNWTSIVPDPPIVIGKPVSAPATIEKSAACVPLRAVVTLARFMTASPVLSMVRVRVAEAPAPLAFQRRLPKVSPPPDTTSRGASLSPATVTVGSVPLG